MVEFKVHQLLNVPPYFTTNHVIIIPCYGVWSAEAFCQCPSNTQKNITLGPCGLNESLFFGINNLESTVSTGIDKKILWLVIFIEILVAIVIDVFGVKTSINVHVV